jgi:hypothetical protein
MTTQAVQNCLFIHPIWTQIIIIMLSTRKIHLCGQQVTNPEVHTYCSKSQTHEFYVEPVMWQFLCVSNLQRFPSLIHHADIYNHMMNKYEVNINSISWCVLSKPSPICNLSLLYVFIMYDSYTIFTILFNIKLINFKYITQHTETYFHYTNTFIHTCINTLKWLDNESDKNNILGWQGCILQYF